MRDLLLVIRVNYNNCLKSSFVKHISFNIFSSQNYSFVKHIKFEKRKELKKKISKELRLVAWHLNRWWDWCVPQDKKKQIEPIFTK